MRRRIIVEVDIKEGHLERFLLLCVDLCDHLEKHKDKLTIVDYGLGVEVPQVELKALTREYVDHASKGPT